MAKCNTCGKKISFLSSGTYFDDGGNPICAECAKQLRLEEEQLEQQEQEARDKAISKVILTTGGIKEPYEILDTVIALEKHVFSEVKSSINPSTFFDGVKNKLRSIAYNMGADAVVYCRFEYRASSDGYGIFYDSRRGHLEIFAYGTAVKVKEKSETGSKKTDFTEEEEHEN